MVFYRLAKRLNWLKGLFGNNGVLSIGNICWSAASLQKALRDSSFIAQCMLCSLTELYVMIKAWLVALNTRSVGDLLQQLPPVA